MPELVLDGGPLTDVEKEQFEQIEGRSSVGQLLLMRGRLRGEEVGLVCGAQEQPNGDAYIWPLAVLVRPSDLDEMTGPTGDKIGDLDASAYEEA